MNPFAKRRLRSSPVAVTQLGLGGAPFGNVFNELADQAASDIIAAAYAAGVRYFDTAPLYGRGRSESRLGAGLAPFDRASFVISSKVGYTLVPRAAAAGPFDNDTRFDYSRDGVLRSLESSLRRLRTDRIDIVLIHDPDESISNQQSFDPYANSHFAAVMEGAYPALHELRAQGVIGALGAGMNQWQMLSDFARAGDFDCFMLAGRYTLLEQGALATFLPLCAQKGIGVIIAGPYNSGILATGAAPNALWNYKPAPPALLERVAAIQTVCARHAVPLQAAALQFPFGHPAVASVIPGSRSVAELEANVSLMQHPIPAAFWAELQSLTLLDPAAPVPGMESPMSPQPTPLHRMDDVDRTADPRGYIEYLDQASAGKSMRLLKQRTFALLGARAGSHLLDAGCGTGDDVRALAHLVGPAGRVVGVDSSEAMIAEARKRSAGSPLPVEFYAAGIYQLDFADNTFDAARAERVFMHLNDPGAALAEMQRVVKSGGYLVVVDPDWETLVVDSSDRLVTRKILQAAIDSVVNGWIGRQLVGLFRQQGLAEIAVEPVTLIDTDIEVANQAWGFRAHAARARAAGVVTADEASQWLVDLETRAGAGRFFAALSGFIVRGRKP